MAKILLCCPVADKQSGFYIHNQLIEMGHSVALLDWRAAGKKGMQHLNQQLLQAHHELKPDLTIIIKGIGFVAEAIDKIREFHKNPIVGWIFDVTLGGTYVKDVEPYVKFLTKLDKFYTMDADAVPELKELGVNVDYMTEGCHIPQHKPVIFNSFQKKKYGADIVFLGSTGSIHPNREKLLKRIADEGFDFKIYGEVGYEENSEPEWIKKHHTGYAAINNYHSMACRASKIVIGIDGWPERKHSMSARIYRTLCAGAFLLTTHTKDIEDFFVPGEHLDVFDDENDMIEKIIKYLQDDELREKIAKAGQELVQKEHTFKHRLQRIINENIQQNN